MAPNKNPKLAATLFFASGTAFLIAGALGKQTAFYAIGAALLIFAAIQFRRVR